MLSLIRERVRAGVDVRVIGRVAKAGTTITWAPLAGRRLHVRAMIADGRRAFIGSQSLKGLELDKRREVGLIIRERAIVRQMESVFAEDWAQSCKAADVKNDKTEKPAIVAEVRELVEDRCRLKKARGQDGAPTQHRPRSHPSAPCPRRLTSTPGSGTVTVGGRLLAAMTELPHDPPHAERRVEDRIDAHEAEQPVPADGGQPRRGDAAAVAAVGRAAELARADLASAGRPTACGSRARRCSRPANRAASRRPRSGPSASGSSDNSSRSASRSFTTCCRSSGRSFSADSSPTCGVYRLNQIFRTCSLRRPELGELPRYPSRPTSCRVTVQWTTIWCPTMCLRTRS